MLVVKEGNENNEAIQALVEALHSDTSATSSTKSLTVRWFPHSKLTSNTWMAPDRIGREPIFSLDRRAKIVQLFPSAVVF